MRGNRQVGTKISAADAAGAKHHSGGGELAARGDEAQHGLVMARQARDTPGHRRVAVKGVAACADRAA
jgi:hypothetical protein